MTQWEPATEAEAAMRDALRANDQDLYFRVLARTDLLLPVSAQAAAGHAAAGWGTWTTGGRIHVLAFTSAAALRACLAENAGAAQTTDYHDLAGNWPNQEWWLAVNPGLPIEGYLPAWFVSQLARGEVRLPGRTMATRARLERVESLARARASASVPGRNASAPVPDMPGARAAPPPPVVPPPVAPPPVLAPQGPPPGQVAPTPPRASAAAARTAPPRFQPPRPAALSLGPDGDSEPSSGWLAAAYRRQAADLDAETGAATSDGPLGHAVAFARESEATPPVGPHDGRPAASFAQSTPVRHSPVPARPIVIEGTIVESRDEAPVTARATAPPTAVESRAGALPIGSGATAEDTMRIPSGVAGMYADQQLGVDGRQPAVDDSRRPVDVDGGYPDDAVPTDTPQPTAAAAVDFEPANEVEESLFAAAGDGSTDTFLSTLLLARVLLPVAKDAEPGRRPGDDGFVWRTQELDGEPYVVVYTSPERLADHIPTSVETIRVKFVQLIRKWPNDTWSFAVNPGTPVGAKLPGSQIIALANWAAEVGLRDDEGGEPVETPPVEETAPRPTYTPAPDDPNRPIMMQKTIAPGQLSYYLERGYDRVSGFVHRAGEVAHLANPAKLYAALGLNYPGSPFSPDATAVHVLRWPAYRPNLYRIPYGGQNEAAMRAMEGWVIERPPFRGNGFAPGESSDVVAEFKVDSVRLPHGAQLVRIGADRTETVVATLDSDSATWQRMDGQ